ncbi:hypothetical protein ATO12_07110 [Aquimarina atlantica]|uniref:Uncharacterized protein n=1 Tax=Aquimarina atlantica TaxID=1317122 RepID=A0A023BNS2_9FLAO|nr:hypothetical protein [Aquimarina atlantica]EZH71569.1 hypothetical protein ATO12_07110 [Aquimarina atlantica]
MKRGVLSVIIACIGFYFMYKINLSGYHAFLGIKENTEIAPTTQVLSKLYKITILCIGLLSLYLGIISTIKKHKIGILGIVLSIVLIILACIPFSQYLQKNSAINTDFQNKKVTILAKMIKETYNL